MKYIAPILFSLILSACGGGGGASTTNVVETVPVVQKLAMTKVLQETTEWNTVYNSAVGDLNGDGLEDIVVSGWRYDNDTAYVWVFTQNADGTLTNSTDTILPSHTHGGSNHVFIRDFDGDGRNDIFIPGFRDGTAMRTGSSTMFWGSTGTFVRQDFAENVQAHGACVDDLNGDGKLDIVVAGGGIYYNQGNRHFVLDTNAIQGNSYFTACAVMHTNSSVLLALGNQDMNVNLGIDTLSTYDAHMNFVSKTVLPKNNINDDLISAVTLGSHFVFAYNDNGHGSGVPRRELYDPVTNQFILIDTGLNNEYHAYLTTVNNEQAIFFPGPGGDSRIYPVSTLTAYKPTAFGDMANGVTPGNWSVEGVTVYRNASNGRTFMLQLLEGNSFYVKEL